MKLSVEVKAGARQGRVEQIDGQSLRVWVKEVAEDGKANRAMVKAVARYLHIPSVRVMIVSGHASAHKVIEVDIDALPEVLLNQDSLF